MSNNCFSKWYVREIPSSLLHLVSLKMGKDKKQARAEIKSRRKDLVIIKKINNGEL